MRHAAVVPYFSAALAVSVWVTACNKSPTGPSPAQSGSLEVVGPYTVAPGEAVQFNLIAHMADGTTRDVTKEASWRAGGDVSIDWSGLVTGVMLGQARITATYANTYTSKDVIVVPPGTFRLVGRVFEVEAPTQPVNDARVEATSATGATLVASTTINGSYALYGVAGATSLRVSREGFETLVQTMVVADHETFDLRLRLSAPRPDVSGAYTLTITAAGECLLGLGEGRLPDEARLRRYVAVVTQHGPALDVELSGAVFASGNSGSVVRLRGTLEPGRALFDFLPWAPWDDYGNSLVERLADRFFVPQGAVVATVTGSHLIGTLDGTLSVLQGHSWPLAWCSSARHLFELSR